MSEELDLLKRKRLRRYLKPLGAVEECPAIMAAGDFTSLDLKKNIFFFGVDWYPQEVNYLWAHLLLRCDPLPQYERFSINDLGNMEFNKHPVYSTCRSIRTPLVLVYAGIHEYNFRSNDNPEFSNEVWFREFFSARQANNEPIWVYAETNKYPAIESLATARFKDQVCRMSYRAVAQKPAQVDPALRKKKAGGGA